MRQRKVVVADDDADVRELVSRHLRRAGIEVVEAADGQALLDVLDGSGDARPDLVVSDVHMPGVDGLATLARLRRRHNGVPVIFITAFADAALQREARRLGAVAVLDKPVDLSELRETVINLLGY